MISLSPGRQVHGCNGRNPPLVLGLLPMLPGPVSVCSISSEVLNCIADILRAIDCTGSGSILVVEAWRERGASLRVELEWASILWEAIMTWV